MGDRGLKVLLVLGATAIAGLVAAVLAVSAPAADGDRLPDLGMARIADIKIDKTNDGRRLLRFTAVIVNVGQGPFELHLRRASTSDPMTTSQRIYTSTGWREVVTPAQTVFGGDGHNHWHIVNLENTELIRLDNGAKVGSGVKLGFCFLDNVRYRLTLPGAPTSPRYGGCLTAGTQSWLDVEMGLSVGWGDEYRWSLPDQYVDITGLTPGRYRLQVTADNQGWFSESNDGNNATWVDLQIKGQGPPRIDGYGPAA
jgi:hypothetical protein